MATYNWSTVLPYSIGSALLQEFADFELLVVGDGCTDDSAEVVASIGDPRVRWIGLPVNSGHQSEPNNAGLEQARGEIVAYLGHDDLWLPRHLTDLVAAIDGGADFAGASTLWFAPAASTNWLTLPNAESHIPPSAMVHRRSLFARAGGWRHFKDLSEHPETELWRRYLEAGFRFEPVSRLSVLKFPAGLRRDAYRQRPSHEQANWLARIRAEPNLAMRLLLEHGSGLVVPRKLRYDSLVRMFWRETIQRIQYRLRSKARKPGEAIEVLRRFKGLDPVARESDAATNTELKL